MKRLLKIWLCVLALLVASVSAALAQEWRGDSLEASLLTCAPGQEAYELYGHTAIRVRGLRSGRDLVFNYGVFDFRTPHFAWRFMLGQTDYTLGVLPCEAFAASYARAGRSIEEQKLNLSQPEMQALLASLLSTAAAPSWTYRYNFLYDNCTTRAVGEIERCVSGRIEWPKAVGGQTFRAVIHEFASERSPWNAFGQDLILGAETDAPIGREQQMFSPVYAQRYAAGAVIVAADGQRRPLVGETRLLVSVPEAAVERFPLSPWAAVCLWGAILLALSVWEWRRGRAMHALDNLLLLLWGGAGCIVALLFFFSEHPAVGSNWLVLLLNPLPLLYLPVKAWQEKRCGASAYPQCALVLTALFFAAAALSPQKMPGEIYVLALYLLARSVFLLRLSRRHGR